MYHIHAKKSGKNHPHRIEHKICELATTIIGEISLTEFHCTAEKYWCNEYPQKHLFEVHLAVCKKVLEPQDRAESSIHDKMDQLVKMLYRT